MLLIKRNVLLALLIGLLSLNLGAAPKVKMETSAGTMIIELNDTKSPRTVVNFLSYVNNGFYNGKIFHRVIPGFMIQGGGFDRSMGEIKTQAPIKNEADNGLKNLAYTIAMARTGDPHSATAQFFINTTNNAFLDFKAPNGSGWGYTVFGKVIEGQEVVDKIAKVPTTTSRGHSDVPVEPVLIFSATLLSDKK